MLEGTAYHILTIGVSHAHALVSWPLMSAAARSINILAAAAAARSTDTSNAAAAAWLLQGVPAGSKDYQEQAQAMMQLLIE